MTCISRDRSGVRHTIQYEKAGRRSEWECDAVAVCSGLHAEPNRPPIPGLHHVPRVIHSSEFKARKQFRASKTVMVVGSGETGADVAHLAVTTPGVERVLLCHRDGLHFAPKRNPGPVILPAFRGPDPREPGIPIDVSRANMFDTAYVHPILRRHDALLWEYYRLYIKCLLFISSGTTLGMDQWIGGISPERHHPAKSMYFRVLFLSLFFFLLLSLSLSSFFFFFFLFFFFSSFPSFLPSFFFSFLPPFFLFLPCPLNSPCFLRTGLQNITASVPDTHPNCGHIVFFNKSMKVCPYISQPYRPQLPGPKLWLYALRSALVQTPIPDTHGRRVDLAPWPESIDANGTVRFVNNGREEYRRLSDQVVQPDMLVLCTGYQQIFPFFNNDPDTSPLRYPTPEHADVRHIWKRDDPSVGFIGFVRPSLGAIPPLAELQAQLWTTHLLAPHKIPRPLLPEHQGHYMLRAMPGARITYGVDHESYAYQLALDMGSAPGLCDILGHCSWRRIGPSCKLFLIWVFGAHLNTKFRLRGPWAWDGALVLLTSDEIWGTITRRPILFGTFRMFSSPSINLVAR